MSDCNCESIIIKMTPEGQDGVGIVGIELLSTVGVVKTYRITLTNGTFFDYEVSDGTNIESIEKTSTEGLVDTYTITLTDGSTTTFQVTNGAQGERGSAGPEGPAGATGNGIASIALIGESGLQKTYRITFTNGQHFDFIVTDGKDGVDGKDGKDGQDGAQGPAGNGIVSITKTGSTGLVDHYRITFTDGTHFDYEVTNGSSSGGGSWGSITGTLSDQTDLQQALDAKADIIKASASGSVVSISDGAPYQLDALTVGVDAVQDLHGYDAPWPAGGGKNKLKTDGLTYATPSNTAFANTTQRTFTGNSYCAGLAVNNYYSSQLSEITVAENSIIFTSAATGYGLAIPVTGLTPGETWTASANTKTNGKMYMSFYKSDGTYISGTAGTQTSNYNITQTIPADTFYTLIGFLPMNANTQSKFVDIQLELGSSTTSYAPYSNICPITGHTTASIYLRNENLFDKSMTFETGYYDVGDGSIKQAQTSTNFHGEFIPVLPNQRITANKYKALDTSGNEKTMFSSLTYWDENKNFISGKWNASAYDTTPKNARYLAFSVTGNGTSYFTPEMITAFMEDYILAYGADTPTYVPYQGQSVNIDLGSERYGGVLDVTNGVLRVTHQVVDMGELNWVYDTSGDYPYMRVKPTPYPKNGNNYAVEDIYCSIGGAVTAVSIRTSGVYGIGIDNGGTIRYASAVMGTYGPDFRTAVTGQKIVYPLAEPIEVTLTPETLSTLLGINVLWASTGDIENVSYRADTQKYIDRKVAEANALTRAMIADSATADGKAPKSLSTGDLIIVGDELRKATANIGTGNQISNSNSAVATLADVIKALQ